MKLQLLLISVLATLIVACSSGKRTAATNLVEITTPYGKMKVLLYDDTPLHKENFLSLVEQGKYDSLIFHRVIRDFMIQGGDPTSFHAPRGAQLGEKEIGEPIEAEFRYPQHIHKRGALAAARMPDKVNPDRKSSGSQFYIVQGQRLTNEQLDIIEQKRNTQLKNAIFYRIQHFYEDSLRYYQEHGMAQQLADLQSRVLIKVAEMAEDEGLFVIPDSVREIYMNEGGVPHLDGQYTVFGEVVEGFEVIDSIASVATDRNDRPNRDVWMTMKLAN